MELEKITQSELVLKKKGFNDACGLAHAMELVGDRWALLILRELMLGPRRFGDLRADLPGISANVLTQRLTELEASHVVQRTRLPPPANVQVYGLTSWGLEAEPMILAIGRWATRSPGHDRMLPLSRVAMLLSLKAMIDPERIRKRRLTVGFCLDGTDYRAALDQDGLRIEPGVASTPDILYTGTPRGLAGRIHGKRPLEELAAAGVLTMEGSPVEEVRFVDLFHLPPRFCP
jgi:DNA-binding HxlR family transcriptional regulator